MNRVERLLDMMGRNIPSVTFMDSDGKLFTLNNWEPGVTQAQAEDICKGLERMDSLARNPVPNRSIEELEAV